MSCTQIQELLPWFANGTLGDAEKATVEAHLAACESCRSALDETIALGAAATEHLPIDLLLDLADGTPTSAEDAEPARLRLAVSSSRVEELNRARGNEPEPKTLPFPIRRDHATQARPSPWLAVAAAALLVTSLAWFTTWQKWDDARAQLDQLAHAPIVNPQMVELVPETIRRGGSSVPTVDLGDDVPFAALVLISDVNPPHDADLGLEIVGPDSRTTWRQGGLERSETGTYTVLLPTAILSSGEYRARIVVPGTDSEETLEAFRFRVAKSTAKP
ncbi:MAG: zf-HC2 domain-containing protein [Thermoanaerobaculia bacterium]|nr:zf-HC2 domain-containing protein [Thermoanaerobaculia bacterium]